MAENANNAEVAVTGMQQLSREALAISGNFDYSRQLAMLSPEDTKKLRQLTDKLTSTDMSSVRMYGSELSALVARNGEELLNSAKMDKTNEITCLTKKLMKELNMIDLDGLEDTSWHRFCRRVPGLRRFVNSIENVFAEYASIKDNVKEITKQINGAKVTALSDNTSLEQIFNNNVTYINNLRELILAAKLALQDNEAEFEALKADPMAEPWQISDMADFRHALEKRITDMETEAFVFSQNLSQIRIIQKNNSNVIDRADTIVTNIIPMWTSQLAISVTLQHQADSTRAEKMIADVTSEMLKKSFEITKNNSIATAREGERPMIDIDTIKSINKSLTDLVTETQKLYDAGAQARKEVEKSIEEYTKTYHNFIAGK